MGDKEESPHHLASVSNINNNNINVSNSGGGSVVRSECALFARGFGTILRTGDFSDVTVVIPELGKEFELHKMILSFGSKYFREYFDRTETSVPSEPTHPKDIRSSKLCRMEIQGPFAQYFNLVVKYLYEGMVDCSNETAIPLLAMANFYKVKGLKREASTYIANSITRDNAVQMLQKAITFDAEDVAAKCITVICKHFNQIVSIVPSSPSSPSISHHASPSIASPSVPSPLVSSPSPSSSSSLSTLSHSGSSTLNSLSLPVMLRLMHQNNIAVSSEYVVYRTVCSYIQANKADLSQQDIYSLFETVRFPWLTYQQLTESKSNPLVPHELITEALFARLQQHEAPKTPNRSSSSVFDDTEEGEGEGSINRRLVPRAQYAISLQYTSDFDDRGVFYWIGTNGGTEEWVNPHVRGRVRVTCSSQEKGSVVDVVGRTPTECWTADVPASWISINLGSRTLLPNHYTLRHGGNSKADALRNWTLQGSTDAVNWTVLVRHANDTSLNGNFAACSWPIPHCPQPYRHFRVLQTGRNSSTHNFLSLSGIEFYGDLYEMRKPM
eukprot:TRINITY_DN9217_c0_g1_i3.p1 TRINITY_DN9217_c0_g1~~TRINITY_DN9217_c0_g1_i3.p1  ORF type:complete len:565 (-),score=134.25 TRINITY_DN9217_c0_g1_i3:31-1695(-)